MNAWIDPREVTAMWVSRLKKEYASGKRELEKYRATLAKKKAWDCTEQDRQEITVVDGMIADLNYAIEWMRSGRRPNSSRGVDIKDAYSRSILMNMDLLPAAAKEPERELSVTQEQKQALVSILMKLSPRERQCYLLHMAQGMSFAEIGRELKLTKRSVQEYVSRAKSKTGQEI